MMNNLTSIGNLIPQVKPNYGNSNADLFKIGKRINPVYEKYGIPKDLDYRYTLFKCAIYWKYKKDGTLYTPEEIMRRENLKRIPSFDFVMTKNNERLYTHNEGLNKLYSALENQFVGKYYTAIIYVNTGQINSELVPIYKKNCGSNKRLYKDEIPKDAMLYKFINYGTNYKVFDYGRAEFETLIGGHNEIKSLTIWK